MRKAIIQIITGAMLFMITGLITSFGGLVFDSEFYANKISRSIQKIERQATTELLRWHGKYQAGNPAYLQHTDQNPYFSYLIRHRQNDSLVYYRGHTLYPMFLQYFNSESSVHLSNHERGIFYVRNIDLGSDLKAVLIIPIKRRYPVQNQYLNDRFLIPVQIPADLSLEFSTGIYPVANTNGDHLFYVKPGFFKADSFWQWVLFLTGFAGILLYFSGLSILLQINVHRLKSIPFVSIMVLASLFIWLVLKSSGAFSYFDILPFATFEGRIPWLPIESLQEALFVIFAISWMGFCLLRYYHARNFHCSLPRKFHLPLFLIFNMAGVLLIHALIYSSKTIWNIPLNFFATIENFRQTGLIYLSLLVLNTSFFSVSGTLIRLSAAAGLPMKKVYTTSLALMPVVLAGWIFGLFSVMIMFTLLLSLLFSIYMAYTVGRINFSLRWLVVLLIFNSLLLSTLIHFYSEQEGKKEVEALIRHYQNDEELSLILHVRDFKDRLEQDGFLTELLGNVIFHHSRQRAGERIRTLFSRDFHLLRNYRIDYDIFRADSISIYHENRHLEEVYEHLNDQEVFRQISPNVWSSYHEEVNNSVAFVSTITYGGTYYHVQVTLNRAEMPESRVYPVLLQDQSEYQTKAGWDFAVYLNRVKMQHIGRIWPDKLTLSGEELAAGKIHLNGNSAYVVELSPNRVLLYDRLANTWYHWFTLFLLLFFFFFFLVILIVFVNDYVHLLPFDELTGFRLLESLGNKIYITLFTMTMIAFLVAAFVSVNNFNRTNQKYHYQQLHSKIRGIESEIQSLLNEGYPLQHIDINQLARTHDVDINIYNKTGRLLQSSQPEILATGIVSPYIPLERLARVVNAHADFIIGKDHVGNLEYLYALSAINTPQGDTMFLSLPYYAQQHEQIKELRAYLSMLINIYVLMIYAAMGLGLLIIRLAITPLQIIGDQIKSFKLDRRNEKIAWDSNDEIGKLVKQYNAMVDQLEQSAKLLASSERKLAWSEMARQIAHEIKNPLTPMKLNLQYLQRLAKKDREAALEQVDIIVDSLNEQIDNLSAIASSFAEFAQLPDIEAEPKDIVPMLSLTVSFFHQQAEGTISLDCTESKMMAKIDKSYFLRVLNNLINNAYQATPTGRNPSILVHGYKQDGMVYIEVSDNGTGIHGELAEKIFQPHFSTKSSGQGLGLAISRKLIEHSGGTINWKNNPNLGATFTVTLPEYTV